MNVILAETGKPVESHRWRDALYLGGIPRAIKGDDPAGKGWQNKRMLGRNGLDRAAVQIAGIPNPKGCRLLPNHN